MAATGAAVADKSLGLLGRGRAGRSSIFFLATVGHQKDGGAAAFCAGPAGKGAWDVWGVDDCLGAAIGGRQAASKADTALFLSFLGGVPNVLFVSINGRVTQPQHVLIRLSWSLCKPLTYSLDMSYLEASGKLLSAHNLYL